MRKTSLIGGLALTVLSAIAPGCVSRPVISDHKEAYDVLKKGRLTQSDDRYKAKIVTVGNQNLYTHETLDRQVAMFDYDQAIRVIQPGEREERIFSGEGHKGDLGVYVLEKARERPGKKTAAQEEKAWKRDYMLRRFDRLLGKTDDSHYGNDLLDGVFLRTSGGRSKTASITRIKPRTELDITPITEQDCKYNIPQITFPKLGRCYVIQVPEQDMAREGESYNFVLIPVKGSQIIAIKEKREDDHAKLLIRNPDNVWRPMFQSYKLLECNRARQDEAAELEAKRLAAEAEAKAKANAAKKAEEEKKKRQIVPRASGTLRQ